MTKIDKYVTCIKCAHVITFFENQHLRCNVSCPSCGRPDAFGPDVFVPDFEGYTMDEVIKQNTGKVRP